MTRAISDFGVYLRRLRRKHGMTVRDVSRMTGVPESTIFSIEVGKTYRPRTVTVNQLMAGLDQGISKQVSRYRQVKEAIEDAVEASKLPMVISQAIAEGFAVRGRFTTPDERADITDRILAAIYRGNTL